MNILNLTRHTATSSQSEAGVIDLDYPDFCIILDHLTFKRPPSMDDLIIRADIIASIAVGYEYCDVLIGGPPYLTGPLITALRHYDLTPWFSFNERATDAFRGKQLVKYKHTGFVESQI